VPEEAAVEALPVFEREKLPYVLKPFQFHDLLEKVSDLLVEAAALANPIRRVRQDSQLSERKRKEGRAGRESGRAALRNTSMFARREEYSMTEEEIAEYEKAEREESELKKKKRPWEERY
jgi:DNA-nicking Smr family endonuclease